MLAYALKRLFILAISLAIASLVIFLVVEVAPGDPASFMLGINARPDTVAALRAELGLDLPVHERYLVWVSGMVQGDFGTSYTYRAPVAQMVAERVQVSLPLALYALLLSTLIAFPAGIFAAARRGKPGDVAVMGATQLGVAVPNFWFAMLLVLLFALKLRWFSAGGFPGWEDPLQGLKALTLPAVALALPQAAILARVMRSALIDILHEDFIRTARAKGASERRVVLKHALKGGLLPVVSFLGPAFAGLISGSFIIETIFFIPGLGRFFVTAAFNRDYTMVIGTVLFYATLIILLNLLVDIVQAWLNPRTRLA